MNLESQSATYSSPVYADPAATMSGGTPLIVAVSRGRADDYHVTVKLQLLQAYERAIFELQQQVVHYRALVEDLLPKSAQPEELRLDSSPLNPASVRLLDSIASLKTGAAQLRGHDEPDED